MSSITLTASQLKEAFDFIAPDDEVGQLETEITIEYFGNEELVDKVGYYAYATEYPEEGSIYLGL